MIVKRIGKEKGNQKVVCRCPDCGKEFTTWISTFYRNINMACDVLSLSTVHLHHSQRILEANR